MVTDWSVSKTDETAAPKNEILQGKGEFWKVIVTRINVLTMKGKNPADRTHQSEGIIHQWE